MNAYWKDVPRWNQVRSSSSSSFEGTNIVSTNLVPDAADSLQKVSPSNPFVPTEVPRVIGGGGAGGREGEGSGADGNGTDGGNTWGEKGWRE